MSPAVEEPHPTEQDELEFQNLVDDEQYEDCRHLNVRIFMDGSKIERKVGVALSMWNSDVETKALKLTLSPYCTVSQAELLALCRTVKEALKSKQTTFGVFSDCMATLQAVVNRASFHPLAVESRDALRRCSAQNKHVSLFWIKAYAGLDGNEKADFLAKEAALGPN